MPDPIQIQQTDPRRVDANKLAELSRRLDTIERASVRVLTGNGAPTMAVRDGALYVRQDALTLYVRQNGGWRTVTLT